MHRALLGIAAGFAACGPSGPRGESRTVPSRSVPSTTVIDARGAPVANALVTVLTGPSTTPATTVRSRNDGGVTISLPAPEVSISATSPSGYAWLTKVTSAPKTIALSNECKVVRGRVAPANVGADGSTFIHVTLLDESFATFTAAPSADGEISLCVPSGQYVATIKGSFISIPSGFSTDQDAPFSVAAFESKLVREPEEFRVLSPSLARLAKDIPDDVRVIGVGESNHGTKEFMSLRGHLLFELAKEGRPVVLMLESGVGETFALDDYVHGKSVDVEQAIRDLGYWMWNTTEFVTLLREIREYNATARAGATIRVLGFDVQDTAAATNTLLASMSLTPSERSLLARVGEDRGKSVLAMPEEDQRQIGRLIERAQGAKAESDLGSKTTRTVLSALALQMRLESLRGDMLEDARSRDRGMALVVNKVLATSAAVRIVAFAHNNHLARESSFTVATMGQHLAATLGRAYYPIGLLSREGEAWAWNPAGTKREAVPLPVAPPHTFEGAAAKASSETVIVEMEHAPPELRRWLDVPRYVREFGAQFSGDDSDYVLRDLPQAFDALVVIPRSTATTQLKAKDAASP